MIQRLAYLILPGVLSAILTAQTPASVESPATGSPIRVTHVLGLEGVPNNHNGNLSIQGNALRFQRDDGSAAQIGIRSIQDVSLGTEDKQVGGTPMAIGRMATPYGGGGVIALFAHKKYDTVTVEYVDSNGGIHGAIFQLKKGKGQVIRNELLADGANVSVKQSGK
jgi:hypothetical protein